VWHRHRLSAARAALPPATEAHRTKMQRLSQLHARLDSCVGTSSPLPASSDSSAAAAWSAVPLATIFARSSASERDSDGEKAENEVTTVELSR
jgi:hypothetical protein